jgi:molybdate transport system substrate-binding protein
MKVDHRSVRGPLHAMRSLAVMLGAWFAASSAATAAEIRVYSGGAPQAALKVLGPEFEQASGHKLTFTYAVVGEILKRLQAGEKADVILLPVQLMSSLEKAGTVRPESRSLVARVGTGVIVREGASAPDISSPDALRKALLEARSIVYPDPKLTPGGKHLTAVLAKLGIGEAVRSKITFRNAIDGGITLVANGDAELGLFLVSEIAPAKGIALIGLLPAELQNYVVYAGAVAADTGAAEAGAAFLEFLTDPANQARWKTAGFEPAGGRK